MPNTFLPPSCGPSQGSGNLLPVANSSGDVAAATATATLPAAAGKTTYIEGFDLTGGGATSATVITGTVTGLLAAIGTLSFDAAILAGAAVPAFGTTGSGSLYSVRFPTPLPASALNTAIVVSFPTFGSGNLHACVSAYGFQA